MGCAAAGDCSCCRLVARNRRAGPSPAACTDSTHTRTSPTRHSPRSVDGPRNTPAAHRATPSLPPGGCCRRSPSRATLQPTPSPATRSTGSDASPSGAGERREGPRRISRVLPELSTRKASTAREFGVRAFSGRIRTAPQPGEKKLRTQEQETEELKRATCIGDGGTNSLRTTASDRRGDLKRGGTC
jgi:hypothetical protein